MNNKTTIGEKYGPAMEITDQAQADAYFEECVAHQMAFGKHSREECESIERRNLGYFAGYFDHETRLRVERMFQCTHPAFGSATNGAPDPQAAFDAGVAMAQNGGRA